MFSKSTFAECPDCVTYLQTYRATIRLGKRLYPRADGRACANVPEELVAAVLAAPAER